MRTVRIAGGGCDHSNDSNTCDVMTCVQVFDDMLMPARLIMYMLPIPNELVPGYAGYIRGIATLDRVVERVLSVRHQLLLRLKGGKGYEVARAAPRAVCTRAASYLLS